jgi:murein DD-endopeptidase MepM/ murein hydrolase activator NlpD
MWRISSPFGPRWGKMHNGVDLPVSSGTLTRTPLRGTVVTASFNNDSCGGTIVTEHTNPFEGGKMRLAYCHMKEIYVTKGEKISKGESIGLTGGLKTDKGTGNSLGAHLHFGVKFNETWVDPNKYFEAGELKSTGNVKTIVFLVYISAITYVVYSLIKKR